MPIKFTSNYGTYTSGQYVILSDPEETTLVQMGKAIYANYPTDLPARYSCDPVTGNVTAMLDPQGNEILIGGIQCELFGASPSATAAVNAAAIQTALDTGGVVSLSISGVYLIDKTLLIGSHTSFSIGKGVKIRKADGTPCHIIRNKHCQNAIEPSAFTVSGGTAVVTESGHTRVVGGIAYIEGALTNTDLNGAHTITAVTSNTWSYACAGANPTNDTSNRIFVSDYNPLAGTNFVRASNVVTVTETGHTRNIGDRTYIAGLGGTNTFNGIAEITDATTNTWTYNNTGVNETATGTAQLLGDTNISILNYGEIDGNLAGNAMDSWYSVPVMLGNIGFITLYSNMIRDGGSRAVQIFNVNGGNIPRMHAVGGKGTIQVDCGCDNLKFGHVSAYDTTDDIIAFGITGQSGTFGSTASPSGQRSNGTNTVDRITGSSVTGMLKLFAFTGYDNGTVIVGSIVGNGKAIAADVTAGVSGGTMKGLEVGHIDCVPASGAASILFSGLTNYGNVVIRNAIDNGTSMATTFFCHITTNVNRLRFDNLFSETYNTSYPVVMVNNGATIRELAINNSRLTAGNGGDAIRIASGATVTLMKLSGVEFSGAGTEGSGNYYGNLLNQQSGGTLNRLAIHGVDFTVGQGNAGFMLGGASQTVEVDVFGLNSSGSKGRMSVVFGDNSSSTSANVRFSGMHFGSIPANNVFQLSGSGTWNIHGSGLHLPVANKFALLTTGTVNVSIDCPEVRIDMGANAGAPPARLVPVAGDRLYNTNATGSGHYFRTAAGAWQLVA